MLSFSISPEAEADLDEIWVHIASRDAMVADRQIEAIGGQFEMLQSMPHMGRQRSELRQGLRSFPVGSFLVFYQTSEDNLEIVRVLHGARDIPTFFGEGH